MNLPTKLTVLRLILSGVIIALLVFPFHLLGIQKARLFETKRFPTWVQRHAAFGLCALAPAARGKQKILEVNLNA